MRQRCWSDTQVIDTISAETDTTREDIQTAVAVAGPWATLDAIDTDTLRDITIQAGVHVRPALIGDAAPRYPAWGEIKRDGIRMLIHRQASGVASAFTRNGNDWIERVPGLKNSIKFLSTNTILDGELHGTLNGKPATAFQVMDTLNGNSQVRLEYYAFDLLLDNGEDLLDLPLLERRGRLQKTLAVASSLPLPVPLKVNDGSPCMDATDAKKWYQTCLSRGHEGAVFKAPDDVYHAGQRMSSWWRQKQFLEVDLVVVGIVLTNGRKHYRMATKDGQVVGDAIARSNDVDSTMMLALMTHGCGSTTTKTRHGSRLVVETNPVVVATVKVSGVRQGSEGLALRDAVVMMPRIDKQAGEATTAAELAAMRGA